MGLYLELSPHNSTNKVHLRREQGRCKEAKG